MPVGKDNNGVWYFKVSITAQDENGNTVYKQIKRKSVKWNKSDAKNAEREFLNQLHPESVINRTYHDVYLEYIKNYSLRSKERTLKEMVLSHEKYILPFVKSKRIDKITLHDIERFQNSLLQSPLKNSTIIKHQLKFFQVLRYAQKKGYISRLVLPDFVKKTEPKLQYKLLTKQGYEKLIEVADPLFRIVVAMLYFTGLRKGELLALTFDDVPISCERIIINKSLDALTKKIGTTKTSNSNRIILIPQPLKDEIQMYYNSIQDIDYDHTDQFILAFTSDTHFTRLKSELFKKAEIDEIRFHDFRHTHVSLLISLGFNAFEIAKRIGDSVEMVYRVYGHLFKDYDVKMMESINQHFSKD